MKKLRILLLTVPLLFLSCNNDDNLEDGKLVKDSGDFVIMSTDGLRMEFCLIDTNGSSNRNFKVNDDFVVQLKIVNQTDQQISIHDNFMDSDFFRVLGRESDVDYGTPYTSLWCADSSGSRELVIPAEASITLSSPWVLMDAEATTFPLCKEESQDYLAQGEYVAVYDLNFTFNKGDQTVVVSSEDDARLVFYVD